MKLRGAIFWLGIFILLLAYVLWRERGEVVQGTVVLNLNPDDIVKVIIHRQQEPKKVILERQGKNWKLTKPVQAPADKMTVDTLLNRFKNLMANLELDEKRLEYGLSNPPVSLSIHDRSGRTYKIQFGNKTHDNLGVYAIVEGRHKPVVLTSLLLDDAKKSPDDFRDKRLLVFNKNKVTKLALIYPGKQIVCERKGKDEWKIFEPMRLEADNSSINNLLDRLSNFQAQKFVTELPKENQLVSYQLDKPTLQVKLWLRGRKKPLSFKVGKQSEVETMRYYARSYRFPAVVLVDDFDLKEIRKSVSDLRSKRVLVFNRDDVEKIALLYDDKNIELQKGKKEKDGETRWHILSPINVPADSWRVDDILWTLDGVQAEGFIDKPSKLSDYNLDKPQIEVRLWEKRRKDYKSVWVSKKDNVCYLNTNESDTVYKVRASLLNDLKKSPNDLRDLQIIKFNRDDVEEIELTLAKKKLRLVKRAEKNWELTEPKKKLVKYETVDSILFELESMRAEKWVAEKPAPEHGLDKPQLTVQVKLKNEKTLSVWFGKETKKDNVFISSDYSKNQVYEKAKFSLENLKRYRDELLN